MYNTVSFEQNNYHHPDYDSIIYKTHQMVENLPLKTKYK
jgi:hypothetical protein